MKTKNIFRVFLTAVFVLGTMAINAQTKVYVYKTDGTNIEYNIADVDSITFAAPAGPQLPDHLDPAVDITDSKLKNAYKTWGVPFVAGDLAPVPGNIDRYYELANWTASDDCLANGNLDCHPTWAYMAAGAMGIIQASGSTVPVENGKLYQTIQLEPGFYRLDVNYIESQPGTGAKVYAVANLGLALPDLDKVETDAAAFLSIIDTENGDSTLDTNWDNMVSLHFIVYQKSAVSVGFVGSCYSNARVMFSGVKLWQE